MLAGHADQIGFMVKHISKEGFVYVAPLGGIDGSVLWGEYVTIYGEKGPVRGLFGRKPIHQQGGDERSRPSVDLDKMWIDIGAKNQKEAEKRVKIGDPATFELRVRWLTDDLIVSPGLDDKSGLFVAMEALRLCSKKKLHVGFYAVSTVQEEVGLRGAKTAAYAIDPEVGIAIDVTHASDNPGGNENTKVTPCHLGKGPAISRGPNTNPEVEKLLVSTAKRHKVPYQPQPSHGLLGNDANSMQVSRNGVATGSIGIPNRYMHTQVEMCSLKDLENSAKLLANFILAIGPKTDFTPR
jgi:endoglucanase